MLAADVHDEKSAPRLLGTAVVQPLVDPPQRDDLPLVAEKVASGLAVTVTPALAHSWAMASYELLLSLSLQEDEEMQLLSVSMAVALPHRLL